MAHQAVSPEWDEVLVPTAEGRTDAPSSSCPVEVALATVSGRWSSLVPRNLMSGDAWSYSELARSLPRLSDKVLSERLRELVTGGLVERTTTRGRPVRTAYRITRRGRELRPLLIELYRTGLALQVLDEVPER